MKLKEHLEGYRLDWLASQVVQPTGQMGMNINTFYTFVYKDANQCPQWLHRELERITNRKIS
jgi:hypothetical protein